MTSAKVDGWGVCRCRLCMAGAVMLLGLLPVARALAAPTDVYVVSFKGAGSFKPQTPGELLTAFNRQHPRNATSHHFRTQVIGGELVGHICIDGETGRDAVLTMLRRNRALALVGCEKATPESLAKHKAIKSESLSARASAAPRPIDQAAALRAFDTVWRAFDREYAMFAIKPKVDWAKLRQTYRPRAARARDDRALGKVLSDMLAHLEDLHVYVKAGSAVIPGYTRRRLTNANWRAAADLIGRITETPNDLVWGRTDDGIGYVNVHRLNSRELPKTFDSVLDKLADTRGLILDLRYNGGGSEPLAQQVAGRFVDKRRVYALHQYRSGPKHDDLTPKQQRVLEPRDAWRYTKPVVVLQGQRTFSSAEAFVLMMAQCPQVTRMGDRTAGSSGNPRRIEVGGTITVNLPRWIAMDPQGRPFETVGIPPDVKVDAPPERFAGTRDPVLDAALKRLRRTATSSH